MRRPLTLALVGAALLAVPGCGSSDDGTPVACLEGENAYLRALERAPREVTLADGVPISDCLAENQQGGELATVGAAMLDAATELNAEARAAPGGMANVELGYLIGAAKRGTEGSDGIHAELLRRLEAAATYSPSGRGLDTRFERAYREGFDAGLASG